MWGKVKERSRKIDYLFVFQISSMDMREAKIKIKAVWFQGFLLKKNT